MANRQGFAPSICRVPLRGHLPLTYYPLLFMSTVVFRVAKIKTKSAAQGKTKHNYRLMDTPNADAERTATLNKEYINSGQVDYWSLAEARIEEGIAKTARGKPRTVRDDQVRAVEIVLTASPEWFKRGPDGQAEDMRASKWVADNLEFLKKTFGEKNVVSFTLHQDEKTPHIHAVVIPLTEKGHLSADKIFNPETLKDLQTTYAQAMAPHGLERGVEGSRRPHQDMKQVYGRQDKIEAELGKPVEYRPVEIKRPGWRDATNLEDWEKRTTALANDLPKVQVEAANQRAQEAIKLATENASAKEQAQVLTRQLGVSEGLKKAALEKLAQAEQEKTRLAVSLAGGKPVPKTILELGAKLREEDRLDTKQKFEVHLVKGAYTNYNEYFKGLVEQGFRFRKSTEDNPNQIRHPRYGSEFTYAETRPHDRKISEQVEEQLQARREAREQAELVAKQAEANRVEQTRQKVATRELNLMDRALPIYRWKVGPEELTACLIVPSEKVKQVEEALRIGVTSWAAHLLVQGEPIRRDGQEAVYVKYQASFAHQISQYFDKVREGGGQVYEHASHQTRREQLQAQPQPKIQEREQGPAKSKGFGIGD